MGAYGGWYAMSLVKLADSERWLTIEKVAELKHKGWTDTAVAKHTGLKRVEVKELYSEYKEVLRNDEASQERARDQLNQMVAHYDTLIKKLYDLLDELEQEPFDERIAAQRNKNIATIAALEKDRLDAMQKAGILDAADVGDQLAEMEEQRDMVLNILRNDLCPTCRRTVMEKLTAITNQAEVVVVYDS